MTHSKRTKQGRSERLAVLGQHEPRSAALLDTVLRDHRRQDVQADDVLDALVGFITASADPQLIQRLQGEPAHDEQCLPMEMLHLALDIGHAVPETAKSSTP